MDILIVDDHQLFLDGMRHILVKLSDDISITEANRAEQAIEILESGRDFDLILTDLGMPGLNGMSILQRMHKRRIWLPLVIVSSEENAHTIKAALETGALGFIPKSHSGQHMLHALTRVLDGDIYIPEDIQKQIEQLECRCPSPAAAGNPQLRDSGISRRQYEVLQLLAQGYTNRQIATALYLTEHTVKAHLRALYTALRARNRTECVQIAQRQGILDANTAP